MKKKSAPTPRHHAHMRAANLKADDPKTEQAFRVRRSRIHGRGVYATQTIPLGTRIVEYIGERISHEDADARYEDKGDDDGHTFLFVVDEDICIDAGVGGNEARFINHSCDANCETVIEDGHVYIDAIRDIRPGEELGYDYQLTWESSDDPVELALYDCSCGAAQCRGTMLDPVPVDRKRKPRRLPKPARGKAKPPSRRGR